MEFATHDDMSTLPALPTLELLQKGSESSDAMAETRLVTNLG
jgi:hypothetical protein